MIKWRWNYSTQKDKQNWKDVMVDETIKLDGLTKKGFQMFYI